MIHPRQQWCIQVEVTNACPRSCSNCTRCLPHAREPFFMDVDTFAACCDAVADFPRLGEPGPNMNNGGNKVIGMMGGEPTMHPDFERLCRIMREKIPHKINRGLWTGWREGHARHLATIHETFGPASNYNFHEPPSVHQPILVGIQELFPDRPELMWQLIDGCWMQRIWSSSITRKGFFFCEVAAALDEIFDGPGGVPIGPDCWRHDIDYYRDQVERWCPMCGCAAPLPGRMDNEGVDDISPGNLLRLRQLRSPRVAAGDYREFDVARYDPDKYATGWMPNIYRSEQRNA